MGPDEEEADGDADTDGWGVVLTEGVVLAEEAAVALGEGELLSSPPPHAAALNTTTTPATAKTLRAQAFIWSSPTVAPGTVCRGAPERTSPTPYAQ